MSMSVSTTSMAALLAGALVLGVGGAVWHRSSKATGVSTAASGSLFDLAVQDLAGRDVGLDPYRGRVALVVNVASECGLAGQYGQLDTLHRRFESRGFTVLAFPSNDFWQEPNDEAGIKRVCEMRGVSYPVFARSHVRGTGQSPVYQFLTSTGESPIWNFAKYLVGRDGRPRAFFGSLVSPDSPALAVAIERALAEPAPLF